MTEKNKDIWSTEATTESGKNVIIYECEVCHFTWVSEKRGEACPECTLVWDEDDSV